MKFPELPVLDRKIPIPIRPPRAVIAPAIPAAPQVRFAAVRVLSLPG